MNILCSISTKGRYDTTLSLALMSVLNQTLLPDKLVVFDDNDEPIDVREIQHYWYILNMLDLKGVKWEWLFAQKKGQHYNHQLANNMGYKWVWRLDDDTVAENNVLENLYKNTDDSIGAVGGAVLTPPHVNPVPATGKIENIYNEPNIQWGYITKKQEVDHLHCSFLYRAGIVDYNLALSKIAHREETLFTYELQNKGYKNILIPDTITWHLKNSKGGIRNVNKELFDHDENIFQNKINLIKEDKTIVVLDCGMGDHIVFKSMMHEIKNPVIFTCYPDIVPGRSIGEAIQMFGDIGQYNIYGKMDQWNWKGQLVDAFRKMYVK